MKLNKFPKYLLKYVNTDELFLYLIVFQQNYIKKKIKNIDKNFFYSNKLEINYKHRISSFFQF